MIKILKWLKNFFKEYKVAFFSFIATLGLLFTASPISEWLQSSVGQILTSVMLITYLSYKYRLVENLLSLYIGIFEKDKRINKGYVYIGIAISLLNMLSSVIFPDKFETAVNIMQAIKIAILLYSMFEGKNKIVNNNKKQRSESVKSIIKKEKINSKQTDLNIENSRDDISGNEKGRGKYYSSYIRVIEFLIINVVVFIFTSYTYKYINNAYQIIISTIVIWSLAYQKGKLDESIVAEKKKTMHKILRWGMKGGIIIAMGNVIINTIVRCKFNIINVVTISISVSISIYYFFISKSQKTRDSIEDEIDTMIEKVDEDDIEKKIGKYISVMKETIGNNRNKYLAYQYVLEKEIDLNFSGFWMSTIAVIISVMTVAFTYVSDNNIDSDIELKTKRFILTFKEIVKEDVINYKLFCIICFVIICIIFVSVYYGEVNKARKKYKPVLIALSEIERKWDDKEK